MWQMTQDEKKCLKDQLLSFVRRVTDEKNLRKTPEEVEALPAVVSMLLDGF